MNISDRLKELRSNKGVDQNEVARYLGIERSTYSKYETGGSRAYIDRLIKLSEYFNVSTDYLLGISNISCREKGGRNQ